MLSELIGERIAFKDMMNSWEEAIKVAAGPLLKEGFIKQEYMDAMIQNVHVNGAYMIIVPGLLCHMQDQNVEQLRQGCLSCI